ncbi:YcaQ family DNA glycosylase [Glaciecola sp. MH2013]|uniref:winged helix-turn-helix domain-containing protein n=1 Tax=Glaciecola sp. MH2013 TaxID=2785524 RepID=UPI00189E9EBE|nr:crosslink repair DNA glycosylase YcaQ family protein [Glaciecola sp. MH2013]MBF7073636.1 YcaQ family DNA glycosylase [Glaciecola sp. MH2013]
MIKIKTPTERANLRRIAISSQGLHKPNTFGKGRNAVLRAIKHIGYVQIDTISVVERAHHHAIRTRVDNYRPTMLDELLASKSIFEYWSHAAALLPMSDYRFSLPYKIALKKGQTHWYKNPDRQLMTKVLEQIRENGPMRSRDFESAKKPGGAWWDWKPAKKAIEQLYMEGDLMVAKRDGFQKIYDLSERVLPENVEQSPPSITEFATHLITQQLRCHGVVETSAFTYLRKNPALKAMVKQQVNEGIASGKYEEILMPSSQRFVCNKGAFEGNRKRVSERLLILSPFDNLVIQRKRLSEIFNFDYQIECYVPEAKRRFGYFSLPLLYADRFIGRMDCKAHRKTLKLEIKALHFESSLVPSKAINTHELVKSFAHSIAEFMRFQQCQSVEISRVEPFFMKQEILKVLDNLGF